MGATKLSYSLKSQSLTEAEKAFIQACLLGDGTLSTSGRYYRLRIAHKLAHTPYVLWKYNNLKRLCASEPAIDKINRSLRFGTVGHPEISVLRELWYHPTKQIPSLLHLEQQTLAVWFMDDGCRAGKTVNFSVHNFADNSITLLQKLLAQMRIATTIQSDGKGPRLYVRQNSYPVFKEFVKPYIISCMAYKLP